MYHAIIQLYCVEADGTVVRERERDRNEERGRGGGGCEEYFCGKLVQVHLSIIVISLK
jgi:hypothetical protein